MTHQAPESASEPKTSEGKLEDIADKALARWNSVPKHVQQMEHVFEPNEDCTTEEGFLMAQYVAHAQCHHRTLAQGVKDQVKEIADLRAKLATAEAFIGGISVWAHSLSDGTYTRKQIASKADEVLLQINHKARS